MIHSRGSSSKKTNRCLKTSVPVDDLKNEMGNWEGKGRTVFISCATPSCRKAAKITGCL